MNDFRATMKTYNYSLTSDGLNYIANTSAGSPYYLVSKSNNDVNMIYTSDDGYVSEFKTQLQKRLKNGNVSFENGFEVYRVLYENNGFKYKLKISLKEELNGSSMVGITMQ